MEFTAFLLFFGFKEKQVISKYLMAKLQTISPHGMPKMDVININCVSSKVISHITARIINRNCGIKPKVLKCMEHYVQSYTAN